MSGTRPALSVVQRRILEVVAAHVTEHGYPPSVRELGAAVGLTSSSSVAYQLQQLEQGGYLRRDPNKPRALTVLTAEGVGAEDDVLAALRSRGGVCVEVDGELNEIRLCLNEDDQPYILLSDLEVLVAAGFRRAR